MAIKRLSVNPFPYVMPALIYEVRNSIKIFHTDVPQRLEALCYAYLAIDLTNLKLASVDQR